LFHYDQWTDAAVRRWIKRVGRDRVEDLFALNEADLRGKADQIEAEAMAPLLQMREHVARVLAAGAALSVRDLAVDGRDLMRELGLPPGPRLGRLLDQLLDRVLSEPGLNARGALLEAARALVAAGEV
jgi:tRNA nucleotidyltransferase (CCA-adding enzyme)